MPDPRSLFHFDPYHILLATAGTGIILAFWLPRFISGREPAASALLILAGLATFALVPGMPPPLDPLRASRSWEVTSELAVIISLFGAGIRIDRIAGWRQWRPTMRLLAFAMPLTIAAVALLGWWLAGLTLASGLLLGAVLAPTDPVLAADVQVGPPLEGGEHPVRFTLTTEAGLNDGLAFPFVHLALIIATLGFAPQSWGVEWLARDVVYRIVVGAGMGAVIGWLLGKILFNIPRGNALAGTGSGVVALAGVFLCYGATELVEGYGFVASFVAGVVLRRSESHHAFHRTLHDFTTTIEHALLALLLIGLGGALPTLWQAFEMSHLAIALGLIFLARPAIGWLSLAGLRLRRRERSVAAFYGIRGIGSIYYLAFAAGQTRLAEAPALWSVVALTILISTLVHGLTAGAAVGHVAGELQTERPDIQPSRPRSKSRSTAARGEPEAPAGQRRSDATRPP